MNADDDVNFNCLLSSHVLSHLTILMQLILKSQGLHTKKVKRLLATIHASPNTHTHTQLAKYDLVNFGQTLEFNRLIHRDQDSFEF